MLNYQRVYHTYTKPSGVSLKKNGCLKTKTIGEFSSHVSPHEMAIEKNEYSHVFFPYFQTSRNGDIKISQALV